MNGEARRPPVPLVRRLSGWLLPVFVRLPVNANQITAASLVCGLAAAWLLTERTWSADIQAAVLFVVAYVLDNCDGDIARLKNQCSTFGMHFDSFVDWAVHTAFFLGLGLGVAAATGEEIWKWLGWAAAAGGTINYAVGWLFVYLAGRAGPAEDQVAPGDVMPVGILEWAIFVYRELTRADFCFLVLALALGDVLWVLLPAGAIGAQIYWMTQFINSARRFHV